MEIMQELTSRGAVYLDKHFVYKSGKHGPGYINMDPVFPYSNFMRKIGRYMAFSFLQKFSDPGMEPQVIIGPAIGGISLSVRVADAFEHYAVRDIISLWADKDGDDFVFDREGFSRHIPGRPVLVVEDLLTTGGSAAKVCRLVESHGGTVVGVSAICNRGGVTAEDLGVPRLETLAVVNFDAYEREVCPLCERQVPIVTDIGHGAKFALENPDYRGGFITLMVR